MVSSVIVIIIIFAIVSMTILVVIILGFVQGLQFLIVHGTSMVPALQLGDLIFIDTKVGFNDVRKGDIIVYRTYDPEFYSMLATHRMVSMYHDSNGADFIITKGDNNAISEPLLDYPICKDQYIGKVAFVIPRVGLPQVWFTNINTTDTLPTPEQMRENMGECIVDEEE